MAGLSRRARSQTMVEFAFAFPIFFVMLIAAIQFGVVLLVYADELRLTRESARWLALHASASDDVVAAQIRSRMLPTMIGAAPQSSGLEGGADMVNDDNAAAVYTIGNLTARFTPCLPGAAQMCTHRDRSADGGAVHVELRYDASNLAFLPTHIDLPFASLSIATALPAYREWLVTE